MIRRAQKRFPDGLNFDRVGVDCCVRLEDWRRAEWHLKRLWGLNPWDPNLKRRYAKVAFAQKDYALAVKLYEECAEQAPLSKKMRINLAVALAKLNRVPAALALFKELEKEGENSAPLLNNIGILLASAGRPLEGLDYCRRALALGHGSGIRVGQPGIRPSENRELCGGREGVSEDDRIEPGLSGLPGDICCMPITGAGNAERLEGAKAYVQRVLPEQLARFEKEKGTDFPD